MKVSQRVFFILLCALSIAGCKSKKTVVTATLNEAKVEKYWQNQMDFDYLEARGKATIDMNGKKQNVAMHLRMKKDSILWGKFSLFGIGVTVLINKDSFYMIDNLQQQYVAEDKRILDQYLGFKASLAQVQNLLLGNALFQKELYSENKVLSVITANEGIATNSLSVNDVFRTFTSIITTPDTTQNANVTYTMYEMQDQYLMPKIVEIHARKGAVKLGASLNYQNINTNSKLTFPFKIPKGYRRK